MPRQCVTAIFEAEQCRLYYAHEVYYGYWYKPEGYPIQKSRFEIPAYVDSASDYTQIMTEMESILKRSGAHTVVVDGYTVSAYSPGPVGQHELGRRNFSATVRGMFENYILTMRLET